LKTIVKSTTFKVPPTKTPGNKETTSPLSLTKNQLGLLQQILKSKQATDLQSQFAAVADSDDPERGSKQDNPDDGDDSPGEGKEEGKPEDGNSSDDRTPDNKDDEGDEEKKRKDEPKKGPNEKTKETDRTAERDRHQTHVNDNRLRAAAKSALTKLSKISSQFGRTIDESVCLLHAAAKACQSTNDFRDGAEYVCGQSEDAAILNAYENMETNLPWTRTTYMEFASTILTISFTEEWCNILVDSHRDIVPLIQQKKTEPSRNFLQSAKERDAPFMQMLSQNSVNTIILRNWMKLTQTTALNGLRNREVALKISTHLHASMEVKTSGFGTEFAWGYIIQSAAASDKASSDMSNTTKAAPSNNVQIRVLNHNGVRFEDQQKTQNVFQVSDSSDNDELPPATAMTSVLRALDDNRRATDNISKRLDERNGSWKAGITCYHCAENGHIATECQGKCPSCQGYRGQHMPNCIRRPKPYKGKGKGKNGNSWQDNRRNVNARSGYEADMEPFSQIDRRKEQPAAQNREEERSQRRSRRDSSSDEDKKRQKRSEEETSDRRSDRHEHRSSRSGRDHRSARNEKDKEKTDKSERTKDERSSKNESSRR
jgi:hypothetical protein